MRGLTLPKVHKPLSYFIPIAAVALASCSTYTPRVDRYHPASTEAPESPRHPPPRMLGEDTPTRRTRELLAQRAAEALAQEQALPTDETNIAPTKTQKPAGHEHHHP
jgi:hypothetical protein